jgi:hypothetical protein
MIMMMNLLPFHNSTPESELTCNGPRETINKFHPPTKAKERKNTYHPPTKVEERKNTTHTLIKVRGTKGNMGLHRWPTGISHHLNFQNTTTRLPRNEYSNSLEVAKRRSHRNYCPKQGKESETHNSLQPT